VDLQLHDLATGRSALVPTLGPRVGADVRAILVEGPDAPQVVVVVHHPLIVHPHPGHRRARLTGVVLRRMHLGLLLLHFRSDREEGSSRLEREETTAAVERGEGGGVRDGG
jgi:hypothetical protein